MEIRIECSCGTPYSFDVEPVDGRMPVAVQCPTCGTDGTAAANEHIQQSRPSSVKPVVRLSVRPTAEPVGDPPLVPVSSSQPSVTTKAAFDEFVQEPLGKAYDEHVSVARRAVQLQTDDQLRQFLATEWVDPATSPEAITDAQLEEFREEDLPELQAFADGEPTKDEFISALREELDTGSMKAVVFKQSLSLWTLLWLFLGVGSAYRLGTGETE